LGIGKTGGADPAASGGSSAEWGVKQVKRFSARLLLAAAAILLLALGSVQAQDELVVYTGQHESLAEDLATAFTEVTGIEVVLRAGKDAEMANQIIEEDADSPADIFLSEEPGPVAMLDGRGLLANVSADAL